MSAQADYARLRALAADWEASGAETLYRLHDDNFNRGARCAAEQLAACGRRLNALLAQHPALEQPAAGETAPGDWPEDSSHENGNYFNTCHACKKSFIGHKRRVTCKQCSARAAPETPAKAFCHAMLAADGRIVGTESYVFTAADFVERDRRFPDDAPHRGVLLYTATASPATPESAEPVAIGEIDEGEEGKFVELYPDRDLPNGAKVYLRPTPAASDGGLREALAKIADRIAALYDHAYERYERSEIVADLRALARTTPPTEQAKPSFGLCSIDGCERPYGPNCSGKPSEGAGAEVTDADIEAMVNAWSVNGMPGAAAVLLARRASNDARDAARYRKLLADRATYTSKNVPIQLIVCETHPVHRTKTQEEYRAQVDARIGEAIDAAIAQQGAAAAQEAGP